MTARPASATAAGFPKTACESKPTARWTSSTAPSACCSPCPACRRRSVRVSRKCSTSCSIWAGSCASPVTASSPPPRSRSWSRRSTGSTTRCRRSRSSFSPGAGPAPPPVTSPAPSRGAPSGAYGRSPGSRRCAPRSRSISIACRICCSCWRGARRGTRAAPKCCGVTSAPPSPPDHASARFTASLRREALLQKRSEARPVECRPAIALAAGRNVAVPGDGLRRQGGVSREKRRRECGQGLVLRPAVRGPVGPLELDADREIIARRTALVLGLAGVPGALSKGHVLHDLSVAPDERVRGGDQAFDLLEVRMDIGGQLSGEQPVDPRPAEFPGPQADAVPHQELRHRAPPPPVPGGRQHLAHAGQQSRGGVDSKGRGWRRTLHRLTSYADFARHWKLRILRIWLIALRHLAQGWYAVCFFTRRTTGSGGAGSDQSRAAGEHVRPDRCHPGAFDLRAGRQARYRATDAYPQARDRGAAVLRSFGKSAADRPHLQSRPRPLRHRRGHLAVALQGRQRASERGPD